MRLKVNPMTTLIQCTASLDDLHAYQQLVCNGMTQQDVHTLDEYREMIQSGTLEAWWMMEDDQRIGWCAIYPWYNKYAEKSWHLYGVWVRGDKRQQGLGRQMWQFRMDRIPAGVTVSVSIQPGKHSEALAKSFGFEKIGFHGPWNTYVCYR